MEEGTGSGKIEKKTNDCGRVVREKGRDTTTVGKDGHGSERGDAGVRERKKRR